LRVIPLKGAISSGISLPENLKPITEEARFKGRDWESERIR